MGIASQTADIKNVGALDAIEFFKVKSQEAYSQKTKENLQYAINALIEFVGDSHIDHTIFTESMVGEWVSRLLFQGYSPKTISNNILKRIATLYNKAAEDGLAQPTGVFKTAQNRLNNIDCSTDAADSNIFGKVQELIRRDYSSNPILQLAKDILLFSIFKGGMSFEEIANYNKDEYKGDNKAILEIVNRYSKPKNKYLFPLNRTNATAKRLVRHIQQLLEKVLKNHGLIYSSTPTDITFRLWAYLAMNCGVSASDVSACIAPRNKNIPVTAFAVPSELTENQIIEIRNKVETTLNHNPQHWYAMHLRPRVKYKNLTDRLTERNISLDDIYYPIEDIFRKVGKKKIFESQPVISWLVFFRTRATVLNRLYKEIGDLAWGYRYLPDYKSPYAVIPDAHIAEYQLAVGNFVDAVNAHPDGQFRLTPGDKVEIIGGQFKGHFAIFEKEIHTHTRNNRSISQMTYRLRLAGIDNFTWTIHLDPRLTALPHP